MELVFGQTVAAFLRDVPIQVVLPRELPGAVPAFVRLGHGMGLHVLAHLVLVQGDGVALAAREDVVVGVLQTAVALHVLQHRELQTAQFALQIAALKRFQKSRSGFEFTLC